MSHAQSLMFICMTFSAHSTRTPNPTFLLFFSHGDDHCDDPRHEATFGQMTESNLTTVYEPNDFTEMNKTEVTPIFFHRPSVTSTYDSADSIATSPVEPDLDDEQIRNMLVSPLYSQEGEEQGQTDHELITSSEKTLCPFHLVSEQVRGDLELCSHTKESRVKNVTPTETVWYSLATSSSSRRK